ncbi:sensor histidine kinase [Paractinoplanes rishiriensis]|uniref:Oxygen sensor histidine kinase NreB n=1 Tax=Paractinoplanes rishiriensis TaxID=1050105 RepID=A0A919JW66_9ACTN|nr:ATP-binding protein [Actinoplanes rishiriensis]GIE94562.1 two-component sensor histidine kinase [Actinoplanes rishiriensis]
MGERGTPRQVPAAVLVGVLTAVASQWPMWTRSPLQAVVNGLVGVLFLATGALLRAEPGQRRNGLLFGLAGLSWAAVWLEGYGTPALILTGWLCSPLFAVLAAVVLLRYPEDRLPHRSHRVFAAVATVWPVAGSLALTATRGHDNKAVLAVANLGAAALALTFCVLLGLRLFRARGLPGRVLMPVLVAAIGAGVGLGFRLVGDLLVQVQTLASPLRVAEAAAFLAVPGGFLVAAVQRRLARATVADLVLALRTAQTTEEVRAALSRTLRDPGLRIVPAGDEYGPDRLAVPLPSGAVVLVDPALARHADLLHATVGAAGLALEHTRARYEAGLAERRRLERDLHDGAQQLLLAVSMRLGTLRAAGPVDGWQSIVERAGDDLRAAQRELRELAHGLYPATLTAAGLGPALAAVAERMPLPVRLQVVSRRWSAKVEAAAYFIICEAVTNAVKHAEATEVTVTVADDGDGVRLTVTDDGAGGADAGTGHGLAGLCDRAAALGGTCAVSSPPGGGTTIAVRLPVLA